jgi:hypothetical protein
MKVTLHRFETDEVSNIAYPVLHTFSSSRGLSDRYYEVASFEIDLPEGTVINEGREDSIALLGQRDADSISWVATVHVPGDENLPVTRAIEKYS